MKRRLAREKAFQSLFQIEVSDIEPKVAMGHVLEEGEREDEFLRSLVLGTMAHKEEIDTLIEQHLENWSFSRLANVEKAVLRLAVYEMKFEADIPINVSMNEAIELAKVFGGEESGRFVNGVLVKITKQFSK
ncbi:transcription antitermination protein NusB [Fictibacillus macauensis ZFHKF-1]|uniref:Transcription antitermination protein NusB n=1 Tax=Fictibacillus macauensis ZFHKF-1 TaxID=1196324 RepID=I8J686_9BACL|nr:transcription antitermination factor NusB [Fictibacillus macauensis]EIT87326.1 transcription antitermination protein NusB [Fictibacillus macauensis ZFHKF-1]